MAYLTSGMQGVDLTKTRTSAEGPEFTVGETQRGNKASEWMYVYALSTIAQFDAVVVNASSNAVPVTTTNASTAGPTIGFAQVAIASTSFGWIATQGQDIKCKVLINCAKNARLYTTATAGELDDTIVTIGNVHGIYTTASISTATAVGIVAKYPHIGWGNAA